MAPVGGLPHLTWSGGFIFLGLFNAALFPGSEHASRAQQRGTRDAGNLGKEERVTLETPRCRNIFECRLAPLQHFHIGRRTSKPLVAAFQMLHRKIAVLYQILAMDPQKFSCQAAVSYSI